MDYDVSQTNGGVRTQGAVRRHGHEDLVPCSPGPFSSLLASAAAAAAQTPAPVSLVASHTATTELPAVPTRALFDQYCVTCHNDRLRQGDLSLADVDPAHPAAHAATLEKVIRKLRAGLMPPARRPRPDEATLAAFVEGLERSKKSGGRRKLEGLAVV